jgi:hypothetical protein
LKRSNTSAQLKIKNSELKTDNLITPTEDFWSRKANAQVEKFEFSPFGIPAQITANERQVLAAAQLSAGRFSRAAEQSGRLMQIQIVVGGATSEPVPADFQLRLSYSGLGDWITVSGGEWGYGFAKLSTRTACVFLSPALAAETRLVSRYFIDHYLLNFILTEWAMLHASCVLDPEGRHLILMVAPHNTGKSTTALHLLRAGYTFLADGMALMRQRGQDLVVGGYPIGEVKLRDDVLASFPEYSGEIAQVREQCKTVVNLRSAHSDRLAEALFIPSAIQICFVERDRHTPTQVAPLTYEDAVPILANNTVYWDEAAKLEHNTATLHRLLQTANLYRLRIGTEPEDIVVMLNKLGRM